MERYEVAVIGGGSAGLTIASGAASFGARVVMVEKSAMGGDCLHYGCVPTKALIRSAMIANTVRNAGNYGIQASLPEVDFMAVMNRMHRVVASISTFDAPERFQKMGVNVLFGTSTFVNPHEFLVGGERIFAKKIVIATGSRAAVPPIPGLSETGYITNVEALQLERMPKSLTILGGGPIGLEFAQVFSRLGADVTVIEMFFQLLPREEAEAAEVLKMALEREGIRFLLGAKVVQVRAHDGNKVVLVEKDAQTIEVTSQEVFVATGRRPNMEIEGLGDIGVQSVRTGIQVNPYLQTTVPHIYAAGDVTGGLQFTHVAGYEGKVVVRNALFPFRQKVDYRVVPWVIYTDPEIAHVGMTEKEAREQNGEVHVYTSSFAELDRAIIDGEAEGFVKVITNRRGQLIGAHVVGSHAGDLLQEIVLAMHRNVPIGAISQVIHAYPTKAEGVKKTADLYWRERFFQGRMSAVMKTISRLTR